MPTSPTSRCLILLGLATTLGTGSCTGGPAGGLPPAGTDIAGTTGDSLMGQTQLVIRKLGPNQGLSGQSLSLHIHDMDPLLKVSNALHVDPKYRFLDTCSSYQLTLVNHQGSPLSPAKWFLDKSEIVRRDTAELDRDTGTLITKFRVVTLYIVAYYHGVGAWANLQMIGGNGLGTCVPPPAGAPTPSPTPPPTPEPSPSAAGEPPPYNVGLDHDFGSL